MKVLARFRLVLTTVLLNVLTLPVASAQFGPDLLAHLDVPVFRAETEESHQAGAGVERFIATHAFASYGVRLVWLKPEAGVLKPAQLEEMATSVAEWRRWLSRRGFESEVREAYGPDLTGLRLLIEGYAVDGLDPRLGEWVRQWVQDPARLQKLDDQQARATAATHVALANLCEPELKDDLALLYGRRFSCEMNWAEFWKVVAQHRLDLDNAQAQRIWALVRAVGERDHLARLASVLASHPAAGPVAQEAALDRLCSGHAKAPAAARRILADWAEIKQLQPAQQQQWWICAAGQRQDEAVKHLQLAGLSIRVVNPATGEGVLHVALQQFRPARVISNLLAVGADPLTPSRSGDTPLHLAASRAVQWTTGHSPLAMPLDPRDFERRYQALVRAGADERVRNLAGVTPGQLKRAALREITRWGPQKKAGARSQP